jgi:hypothetical protein
VRRDGRLPSNQAEIVLSDILIEQLEALSEADRLQVLAELVALCESPGGKHALRSPLAGWNTVVYAMATALVASGCLADDEVTQLWLALALLDVVEEHIGLDGWDFRPAAAPDGLQRAAVAAGLLAEDEASLLSLDEIQAAMTSGWDSAGNPSPAQALRAAFERSRGRVGDAATLVSLRRADRCRAVLPRAKVLCIRRVDHPGPHRAR